MLERFFRLRENGTTVRTEVLAGITTFLTMAYIIVVQPAMLSSPPASMDFQAVTAATCIASAFASILMGLWAKYPVALAPGMGVNAYFAFVLVPAAASAGFDRPWAVGLGVVFVAGLIFLALTFLKVREWIFDAVSPSLKNGIAAGIGLLIAFIGFQNAGLVVDNPATMVSLHPRFYSPDLIVLFVGLLVASVLHVRRVPGSILLGIVASGVTAVALKLAIPLLPASVAASEAVAASKLAGFHFSGDYFGIPDVRPTLLAMDLGAVFTPAILPFVIVFLFIAMFDAMGTLVGVAEQAGFMRDNKLPRVGRAMGADAVGGLAGAALGTSTVTAYIESAAGVEQGGRTGLTAIVAACGFLLAMFFAPLLQVIGSYPPITASALILVGAMMLRNVTKIAWDDYSESIPAFLIIIGIPLSFSIGDGMALGFMAYPLVKLLSGRGRDVSGTIYVLAALLVAYFVFVRAG